jgi:hypothetical protein
MHLLKRFARPAHHLATQTAILGSKRGATAAATLGIMVNQALVPIALLAMPDNTKSRP